MSMKVVVTGAAGFVGRHLVRRLAADRSLSIIAVDNLSRGSFETLGTGVENVATVCGDVRDEPTLAALFKDVEIVFHLAAQANVLGAVEDPVYSFSSNVVGTFNVLRAAKSQQVRRVVFTSSREVYGDPESLPVSEDAPVAPKNAYGASKVAGEQYCRIREREGLEMVVLRLTNVYGPGDSDRVIPIFLNAALRNNPLVIYGREKVLDFVWVGTVVDALVRTGLEGSPPSGPVNVGSGQGTTLLELAERIVALTGSRSEIRHAPERTVEVGRFVADIAKATQWIQLPQLRDPLEYLPRLIGPAVPVDTAGDRIQIDGA